MSGSSCLYVGRVVHKRLVPRQHGFAYRVFALCLDVDEIDQLDKSLRLFSRGRRNLVSFQDRDFGCEGTATVATKARTLLSEAGLSSFGSQITLLCYPRIMGYVFNPLSVYFCRDGAGRIGAIIYEVSNTFGERKSYVIAASESNPLPLVHHCAKEMYVSPYTAAEGRYGFHISPPGNDVVVGVSFREQGKPVLKTHFRGERYPLTDGSLARMLISHPLMTVKVMGAIHVEAARLWAKGVPLMPRFASPAYSSSLTKTDQRGPSHA